MPDFKDDIPESDDLDLDFPVDELPSLDLPDFQTEDDLTAADATDLGAADQAVETEGFQPVAFDGDDAGELELDDEVVPEARDREVKKKRGPLAALTNASPYTVMLGFALLALAVGCLFLFLEWKAYDFNTSAKDPRLTSNMVPVVSCEPVESAFL